MADSASLSIMRARDIMRIILYKLRLTYEADWAVMVWHVFHSARPTLPLPHDTGMIDISIDGSMIFLDKAANCHDIIFSIKPAIIFSLSSHYFPVAACRTMASCFCYRASIMSYDSRTPKRLICPNISLLLIDTLFTMARWRTATLSPHVISMLLSAYRF